MMAAAAALITLQIIYVPTRTGAQVMTAPAVVVFLFYAAFVLESSPAIARLMAKLRRQERADIARFFAVLSLWILPIGLLVYRTWVHFNG